MIVEEAYAIMAYGIYKERSYTVAWRKEWSTLAEDVRSVKLIIAYEYDAFGRMYTSAEVV